MTWTHGAAGAQHFCDAAVHSFVRATNAWKAAIASVECIRSVNRWFS